MHVFIIHENSLFVPLSAPHTHHIFTVDLGAPVVAHADPHSGLQTIRHVDGLVQLVQGRVERALGLRGLPGCGRALGKWVGVLAIQEWGLSTSVLLAPEGQPRNGYRTEGMLSPICFLVVIIYFLFILFIEGFILAQSTTQRHLRAFHKFTSPKS